MLKVRRIAKRFVENSMNRRRVFNDERANDESVGDNDGLSHTSCVSCPTASNLSHNSSAIGVCA